jgi:8-amino-7-oxononanoate synthase
VDGDVAPLGDLARVCREDDAVLVVDEAHGFGVLGAGGRGALEEAGLGAADAPLVMATFGKALGSAGAFVAGTDRLIEMLVQTARPYIYSTAPPPALAIANLAALRILIEEPGRRERLHERIAYLRARAAARGIALLESRTPVQPLLIGDAEAAVRVSRQLLDRGVLLRAMRPPTVPQGTARLRITLTAAHTPEQIDQLLDALDECLPAASRAPAA